MTQMSVLTVSTKTDTLKYYILHTLFPRIAVKCLRLIFTAALSCSKNLEEANDEYKRWFGY